MSNYNVCPCAICEKPISFTALREGVYWAPKISFQGFWGAFWSYSSNLAEDRLEFAHRACWRSLTERRKSFIRGHCDKNFPPMSMQQYA